MVTIDIVNERHNQSRLISIKARYLLLSLIIVHSVFVPHTKAQEASNIVLFRVQNAHSPSILSQEIVTDNAQYTNQPHFDAETKGLYFTQAFELKDSEKGNPVQMDSMYYSLDEKTTTNLTQSENLSEYSPTPWLAGQGFSTILVDVEGKQWLWGHTLKSAQAGKRADVGKLFSAEPIGYHVWETSTTALTFVLGEPHTLQRLQIQGSDQTLDDSIGPSLWQVPGTDRFSYSKSMGDEDTAWIMTLKQGSKRGEQFAPLPNNVTYYAWLPNGLPIVGQGGVVHKYIDKTWSPWLDISTTCSQISRMHAVEKENTLLLAVVCNMD